MNERRIVVRAYEDPGFNFPSDSANPLQDVVVLVRQGGTTVQMIGVTNSNGFFTIDEATTDPETGMPLDLTEPVRVCVNLPGGAGSKYLDFTRTADTPLNCADSSNQPTPVQFACDANSGHGNNPGYPNILLRSDDTIFPKGNPETLGTGSQYCYLVGGAGDCADDSDYPTRTSWFDEAFVQFGFVPNTRLLRVETTGNPMIGRAVTAEDESGATFAGETGGSGFEFVTTVNLFEDVEVCVDSAPFGTGNSGEDDSGNSIVVTGSPACVTVDNFDDNWDMGLGGSTVGEGIVRVQFETAP
ncbi:MAG: hypothetical protein SGILL_001822 [Bacillariaceae sp.]